MASLENASLDATEQRTLERLVRLLEDEFGSDLHGVWLYGSRARGERPGPDSDIDVLVVANREQVDDGFRVHLHATDAALAEGANPAAISVKLMSHRHVEQRREIDAFFIREVDRDKIVLAGEP